MGMPSAPASTNWWRRRAPLNPDLKAAALEADAAAAKVEGAGSLPDPKIQLEVENWRRDQPGYAPQLSWWGTSKTLKLSQELPFWGKRDLRREIAEADARKAAVLRAQVESELIAKVKVAYAEYHAAHLTVDLARDLRGRVDTLVRLARARYSQGLGNQGDVTRAEIEKAALDVQIARMAGERRRAQVAINRLLARPLDAPLIEAPAPRNHPAGRRSRLDALTERAPPEEPRSPCPAGRHRGGRQVVALAERGWYPDFEVGVGAMRKDGELDSYQAMVQMNIPLQWGLRRSAIGEAKGMAGAARTRLESRLIEIGDAMAEAWIALKAARDVEAIIREAQLPQAEIGFQSSAKGYELGRIEFVRCADRRAAALDRADLAGRGAVRPAEAAGRHRKADRRRAVRRIGIAALGIGFAAAMGPARLLVGAARRPGSPDGARCRRRGLGRHRRRYTGSRPRGP
jgi:outer membrane protein TolC